MITKNKKEQQPAAPIKWHGGKSYLAHRIFELMPPHTHYVEPFFGGGAILLNKPLGFIEGHSEVINDIFGDLITFWKVLQSTENFPEFVRRVSMTPFAKPSWEEAVENSSYDPLDRACAFFIRYRQSRQGLGKDFATMSRTRTRRGMNEQVSSWLSAVEGLPAAHERLKRVAIYCEDAASVIRREDGASTFFYCDPPYLSETRTVKKAYSHEMTDLDHTELLHTLGNAEGKFLLSGYPHPLYDAAASKYGWQRFDIKIDNKASSQKIKPKKTECLWANYDL
ncbi:MAG: DNA adenine methylase [Pirellulales bacterium]